MRRTFSQQPYPRKAKSLLADISLLPQHNPPLSDEALNNAIKSAFDRTTRDRLGNVKAVMGAPEKLIRLCIKHLKTRSSPILGAYFYSQCEIDEIFILDAIPHEMQRQRMNIGVFYQYLIIELMRESSKARGSNIEAVFDGSKEGDVVADVKTPGFKPGLRLYASVKKSSDTVGGQDVPGVISRLESIAKAEKNITRPYMCVFCYAEPTSGELESYERSRGTRCNSQGYPFSMNCESWEPGFTFPYISGRSPTDIYKLSLKKIDEFLPFYTLRYRKACSELLRKELNALKLITKDGKFDEENFIKFVTEERGKA